MGNNSIVEAGAAGAVAIVRNNDSESNRRGIGSAVRFWNQRRSLQRRSRPHGIKENGLLLYGYKHVR